MKTDVVVIGGGVNGLTAAILLAKKGLQTALYEKGPALGGVFSPREFGPGFRSSGIWPHVSQVSEEVVDVLGLTGLNFSGSPSVFLPETAASGKKGQTLAEENQKSLGLETYYSFMKKLTPFLRTLQENKPFALELSDVSDWTRALRSAVSLRRLGEKDMIEFMRTAPMPLRDSTAEYTKQPRVQAALALSGCWTAMWGPWAPMGTLSLMWWQSSLRREISGGAPALVAALEAAAKESGVTIHLNTKVDEIVVEQEKVNGIRLNNETFIESSTVVSSCDPKTTFLSLLKPECLSTELSHQISNYRIRGQMSVLHLGLKEPFRFISETDGSWTISRIAEDLTEVERAFDAVKYRTVTERPVLEVWKSSSDAKTISIAAFGTAYTSDTGWTENLKNQVEESILNVIESYAPGIRSQIVAKQLLSPVDIEREYGLTQGHVFHGEWAPDQLLMMRPLPSCGAYSTPIEGLRVCGPGTHPGIGASLISGALAANRT